MRFGGQRRLVVLGFGPIGAGLFAYEASRTGAYAPPVVVDVQVPLVEGLRRNAGRYGLNVAHASGIDTHEIGPSRRRIRSTPPTATTSSLHSPTPTSPPAARPVPRSTTAPRRAPPP
jgi:hypothetical protein